MLNDLSSPASFLRTRRSAKPRDLERPGPDAAQLAAILAVAARTPDHGKLAPWRFVVIGDRDAFAALLESAYHADHPEATRLELEAVDQFARQAPTLVAAFSTPDRNAKIPVWEQELSAGAACMNLVAAATAHGFGAGWLTGWAAYSEPVARALLGSAEGRIAGFIFIGTPPQSPPERPRPDPDAVVSHWPR